ncbi:MAG: hypothetical protein ACI9G1_004850 [Pirellulaceae bacterium]|jgi:hypothetical protein
MARFLIGWELGANFGHVTVQQPIVSRLLDEGHEVVMAVSNREQVSKFMQRAGLPIIRCPKGKSTKRTRRSCTFPQAFYHSGYDTCDSLKQLVDEWFSIFDLSLPDICVFDYSPSGLIAAKAAGIPTSSLGNGFCSPPIMDEFPMWRSSTKIDPRLDERNLLENINTIQRELNLSSFDHLSEIFDVDMAVLTTLPELDHFENRSSGAYEYVGCLATAHGIQPTWPTGEGPRTFAYLKYPGKDNREPFFKTLQHIADSKLPTVAFISNATEKLRSEHSTETLKIYLDPIDLDHAIDHCELAILNGGHGTTVRFALAGKPLLLLPTQMEQDVTARRVQEIGIGLQAAWRNPAQVKKSIAELTNSFPLYRQQALQLASRYPDWTPENQAAVATQILVRLANQFVDEQQLSTV